jgi:hypothetical protein
MGLLVGGLATWRVAHLLAREDGPGAVLVRLRRRLGDWWIGQLLDCLYCLSLWVAAPVAFALAERPGDGVLLWLGLSGMAVLIERLLATRGHNQSPAGDGDRPDAMLWPGPPQPHSGVLHPLLRFEPRQPDRVHRAAGE